MQPAIRVDNLSKRYKLGLTHDGSLRNLANRLAATLVGRGQRPKAELPVEHADRVDADGHFWALRDVSFEVQPGEVVGVIGRNGAGKSTLLKILSRITKPSAGRIEYRGRIASLLEVGTGFHPELTGRENVYLNGTILGMTRAEITRQFDAIVDFAGVEKFIDTPVKRYSSGMSVRLGFAVAAHLDPEILIVDEVLAVGDAEFQEKCLGKMQQVSQSGKSVLFVSHNMASIRALTNRAIVISRGRVAYIGSTVEAVGKYVEENFRAAQVCEDVSLLERPFGGLTRELEIVGLALVDNPQALIEEGTAADFRLTVRARREHGPFQVGITIFRDDHTAIGSTFSGQLPAVPAGASQKFELSLPTQWLAPGRYHCGLSLSEVRANGLRLMDSLADILVFTVEPSGIQSRSWNAAWGSIRLPEVAIAP